MISSNDQKGNYLKCISMGIDHYLVRPLGIGDLAGAIRNCFPLIEKGVSSYDPETIKKDIGILIVEDNKMNQKVIGTMLNTLGYSCDFAEDGYEGFLKAKNKKYDLILMDLILPEMNGFDSARKILAIDKSVLIVAFSADNMPDTRKKAELSGIREFVAKPVRIEDLKKLFARYFKKT
jgi:CheY-like chemotaxis protein